MHWVVDGNNVVGSRPDGWWNDRPAAQARLTQRVAEWCRTHDDRVTVVFDAPLPTSVADLAGANLEVVESSRRGRDAADHEIVDLVAGLDASAGEVTVVTSDRGLRDRLPGWIRVWGTSRFRALVDG
jgi:predicted RNA-binding protein with PIN domain